MTRMDRLSQALEQMREIVYLIISPHRGSSERGLQKLSRCFDWCIATLIIISSLLAFVWTFPLSEEWKTVLTRVETVILCVFSVEYLLRLLTADIYYKSDRKRYEDEGRHFKYLRSVWKYFWTPLALIDLVAILPLWTPISSIRYRNILRALRILRLARLLQFLERYEEVLNKMLLVLWEQRRQLKISLASIGILMMVASVLMYVAECDAPNVPMGKQFTNAFSGLWWAVTTVTTVGYGDLTPVTTLGRFCGGIIALAGVAALAVPTAIISSGFMKESITPEKLQRMLSEKQARQDQMIDALTSRFEEFGTLQTNRLDASERLQKETDARQNQMLADQKAVVDGLSSRFGEFEQHQNQMVQMQARELEQQKLLSETLSCHFAEIERQQKEIGRQQNELLPQKEGEEKFEERFRTLERQMENQRQAIEQMRQLIELHFRPVAKPEGVVKRTMKRVASGVLFWKKKEGKE